ncbi:hypothetical protein D7Z26_05905 [Cohnella endophytica]|uniref:TolB protein n=1 Tax=Cohnella endophytica TaxID=2419778 RepID=A0A494Y3Z2_9BACL|nr:PD40 domain-containing protein [Cohnella endophytica]RKP56175.1 hypothetical protein D7Z26_05905 [Cohnella endophytica]
MNFSSLTRAIVASAFLLIVLGCGQQDSNDREQVQSSSGNLITVMDNPEPASYGKSTVDSLVRLDDVRGMDWLGEDEILIDRENRDFKPEFAEGAEWYPHNMYVYSLTTKTQAPLHAADENQGYAQVSPDRTKVFYKTFSLQSNTGKGYIFDFATGKPVSFTGPDAMDVQNGRWADNDSVVYSTIEGEILRARYGNAVPESLLGKSFPFATNIALLNGRLYFSSLRGQMMTMALNGKPEDFTTNVVWMVPSPDEQRLAIVRKLKSGAMELDTTDLQGNILQAIAQDAQIYGSAWSPDGNKLAYAAITTNGTVRGIYVADTTTGLSSALSLDVKFIADTLHWSPTGNRLMVSSTQPDEQQSRNKFVTYLARVTE